MRLRRFWLSGLMCVLLSAQSTTSSAAPFQVVSGKVASAEQGVTAGEAGALVRLSKGITLRLSPGTKMQKLHKRVKLWLSAKGTTLTHLVALESGSVEVECQDPTRAVLVRTPLSLAAAARSGRMSVSARPDQVSVANVDGSVVWAAGNGSFKVLDEGRVRTVSALENVETTRVGMPVVRMDQNLFGGFGRDAAVEGVDWPAIAGAASYRVSLEQLAPKRRSVARVVTTQPALSPAPQLPAGRYALSVQAIDRFGVEGDASAQQTFGVVGMETAGGAHVDSLGNIVTGPDRRIHLTHTDGLVMKSGPDWLPVPAQIAMPSAEPMHLHLREAGDSRMLGVRVMAPQIKTTMTIGPKSLRWPGENARLEVSFAGAGGAPPAAWFEPRFRVLLGIDELAVTWRREVDKFVTEVPSQTGKGPWILRLEVEDQYGNAIGRDFVEISSRHDVPAAPPRVQPAQAPR